MDQWDHENHLHHQNHLDHHQQFQQRLNLLKHHLYLLVQLEYNQLHLDHNYYKHHQFQEYHLLMKCLNHQDHQDHLEPNIFDHHRRHRLLCNHLDLYRHQY